MSDVDVTFRNENNGKEVEVTVSDDMTAEPSYATLSKPALSLMCQEQPLSFAICSSVPIRLWHKLGLFLGIQLGFSSTLVEEQKTAVGSALCTQ